MIPVLFLAAAQALSPQPVLSEQRSGVQATLQAISPVNDSIVWVGGHAGVILRTLDGGRSWTRLAASGGDSLQFRDVHAVSRDTAYVLSAGPGARSRIYKTNDGGASWELQFLNRDSSAFYDCFDFWESGHGIAVSDAVGGRLVLIATVNGGATWRPVPPQVIPAAGAGEGAFAASGTCLITRRPGYAWIGSGAGGEGKVYRSAEAGATWTVVTPPLARGSPSSGVISLAFRDSLTGAALGGNLSASDAFQDNVARTTDGGRSWTLGGRPPFPGAVYGAAYAPGSTPPVLVAVGPKGAALSRDDGATWTLISTQGHWAVAFGGPALGWMVGAGGRITRIAF